MDQNPKPSVAVPAEEVARDDQLWNLSVLTYPDWGPGVRLQSAWTTDVVDGRNLSESRAGLRGKPRRLLTATVRAFQGERDVRFLRSVQMRQSQARSMVPLFCDQAWFPEGGDASPGAEFPCDTPGRRFYAGGRAMVANLSTRRFWVGTLAAVDPDGVTFTEQIGIPFDHSCRAYPLIEASPVVQPASDVETDDCMAWTMAASETVGPPALPAWSAPNVTPPGFSDYAGGLPVLDLPFDWAGGGLKVGAERAADSAASGITTLEEMRGTRPPASGSLAFRFARRSEAVKLLRFFDSRRGRLFPFVVASPVSELKAVLKTADSLVVRAFGPQRDWSFFPYAALRKYDGTLIVRKVTAVLRSGDEDEIFVEGGWPAFDLLDAWQVTTANVFRFDTDEVTEEWQSEEDMAATLPVVEDDFSAPLSLVIPPPTTGEPVPPPPPPPPPVQVVCANCPGGVAYQQVEAFFDGVLLQSYCLATGGTGLRAGRLAGNLADESARMCLEYQGGCHWQKLVSGLQYSWYPFGDLTCSLTPDVVNDIRCDVWRRPAGYVYGWAPTLAGESWECRLWADNGGEPSAEYNNVEVFRARWPAADCTSPSQAFNHWNAHDSEGGTSKPRTAGAGGSVVLVPGVCGQATPAVPPPTPPPIEPPPGTPPGQDPDPAAPYAWRRLTRCDAVLQDRFVQSAATPLYLYDPDTNYTYTASAAPTYAQVTPGVFKPQGGGANVAGAAVYGWTQIPLPPGDPGNPAWVPACGAPPPGTPPPTVPAAIAVWNTGQDEGLGDDLHWTCGPDGDPALQAGRVTVRAGDWVANGSNGHGAYKWISDVADTTAASVTVDAVTEFGLAFTIPAAAVMSTVKLYGEYAADNKVVEVLVNGAPAGINGHGFGTWKPFVLTRSHGLVAGVNSVVFRTVNIGQVPDNPYGLVVRWTRVEGQESPPLALLSVEGVNLGPGGGDLTCVFDTSADYPLDDPAGADPAAWSARYNDERFQGTGLVKTAFNKLQVLMGPPGSDPGSHSLSYTGNDISDAAGRVLEPFADFPL